MNSVIQTIGPVWTVRILTTFNFLVNVFQTVVSTSLTVVNAIVNFLNGTSNRYVFLRGSCGPIPATMVPNYMTTPIVNWMYDSQANTLHYMNGEEGERIERNLPVLSMGVRTPVRTYSADEFAGMFSYSAPRNVIPNPRLLLYCWSIYSRVWTVPIIETGEGASFSVITNEGETGDHPIFFRSAEDIESWDNLFHVESDETSDDESESETGDDEDGTDGDDEGDGDVESESGDDEGDGDVESESGDDEDGDDEGDGAEGEGDVESESGDEGHDAEGGDVESESGNEGDGEGVAIPAIEDNTPTATSEVSDEERHANATPTVATALTDD